MNRPRRRLPSPKLLLWSILIAGLALRLWGIAFASSTPVGRPDEEIFTVEALAMFVRPYARLFSGWPDGAFELWHLVVWFERAWYHLRFGVGVNLACLVSVDPLAVILPVRVVLAVLGAATAWVVARLAAELAPERAEAAATWAAAFYAVDYLVGRDGHFAVSDALVCFEIAVTLLCCLRAVSRGSPWLVAAAFCAGTTLSTKYSGVGLVFPCAAAAVQVCVRERRRAALPLAGALVAAVIGVLLWSPDIVTRWPEFRAGLSFILGARYQTTSAAPGSIEYATTILPTALGWPGYLLCLAGVIWCLRYRRGTALVFYLLTFSAFVLAPLRVTLARYGSPLIPALAAAGGVAAALLTERLSTRAPRPLAIVVVALLALVAPAARLVAFDRLLARADTRDLARDWLVARGADKIVLTEGVYAQVHAVDAAFAAVCKQELPAALWRPTPILAAPTGPLVAQPSDLTVTVNAGWLPVRLANEPAVAGRGEAGWERLAFLGTEPFLIWENDQRAGAVDLRSRRAPDFLARARGPRVIGRIVGAGDAPSPVDPCWVPAARFSPGELDAATWDPWDAFLAPLTNLGAVERPGPDVSIYANACKG
jgi:4-amino-4-deoxy-L-arabinose transferase-like glycosyltransferase